MKIRNYLLSAICMSAILLTGCNGNNTSESSDTSAEDTAPPVGDFNFIAQTTATGGTTAPVVIDGNDNYAGEDPNVSVGTATSEADPSGTDSGSESSGTDMPVEEQQPVISEYKDLATNVSIQIGADVYVSVPKAITERACDLDVYLEAMRSCNTLVAEEDKNNADVMRRIYEQVGTCVFRDESRLFLASGGYQYWISNTYLSSLDSVKRAVIGDFNLGKLVSKEGNSYKVYYSELGTLLDSSEDDNYYWAMYSIKDVDDLGAETPLSARAVLIANKRNNTVTRCVIASNSDLLDDTAVTAEVLASSVRFTTVVPDNLVTFA